jgi:hypothetical protein
MTPAKIAPLAVYLLSATPRADVSGQIFAVRNNEIFLMSQPRPVRSVHRSEGWTPQAIAEHGMPALKASFFGLDRSPTCSAGTLAKANPGKVFYGSAGIGASNHLSGELLRRAPGCS